MSWLQRYRLRHLLRFSFWLVPALCMLAALPALLLVRWVDAHSGLTLLNYTEDGARQILSAMASSMLTFIVFAVSALLLVLQLASSTLTPRIIALTFASRGPQLTVGLFVFTYTFTLGASARVEPGYVPQIVVLLAVAANLVSIAVFFWFVHHLGSALRPVAILHALCAAGRRVIDDVYPMAFDQPASRLQTQEELSEPLRLIEYTGPSGTFLAFGKAELVKAAQQADCVIAILPQVGDFVALGDPLFSVRPAGRKIDADALRGMVAVGPERTLEQDPGFAFRIMIDIASRALSPAINDPTTAVLALDQIHRELWHLGRKQLDQGRAFDERGEVRLVFPTPQWEDFVALAVSEIRLYGASSIQVARRLRAMLEHLIGVLPEPRRAALREQLSMLAHAVERAFPEPDDHRRADTGDPQGIGGSTRQK